MIYSKAKSYLLKVAQSSDILDVFEMPLPIIRNIFVYELDSP